MEIAVVGSSDFILGFLLAGIRKTYPAENEEQLKHHITRVLSDDMERIPRRLRETLEKSTSPTVIAIGDEAGGEALRERIKRAMGVDLWK
ncbi:MAG: V-type ATP synthase subunit F [Methanomicrobiales archaeon]|nr:V-type ATP synthase subunit F [Methanomicrobiales archaeon]